MKNIIPLFKKDQKDFSSVQSYPGTEGNPFDSILRLFNRINDLHPVIFFIGMALLSLLLAFFDLQRGLILLVFTLGDWLLIALLPVLKITYGPSHSQVFLLFVLRTPFVWLPLPFNILIQLVGTILVIESFLYEPSQLRIRHQVLTIPDRPFENNIQFIQLGDLHLERESIREKKLMKALADLKPDFILFSGDFLNLSYNSDPDAIQKVSDLFSEINLISPAYFIPGSPAVDLKESLEKIIATTSATPLMNTSILLNINRTQIQLIGLYCSHKPHNDYAQLKDIEIQEDAIKILLYHSPDLIYELRDDDNIDLMLSGHTHGGQVRIPFFGAIFTGSLYNRKLQSGLYLLGKTVLSITRGMGFEGMGAPRVRFLCQPEIIHWTIQGSES